MAGGQGVGVVGAQDPQPVGEQVLVRGGGAGRVPRLAPPEARLLRVVRVSGWSGPNSALSGRKDPDNSRGRRRPVQIRRGSCRQHALADESGALKERLRWCGAVSMRSPGNHLVSRGFPGGIAGAVQASWRESAAARITCCRRSSLSWSHTARCTKACTRTQPDPAASMVPLEVSAALIRLNRRRCSIASLISSPSNLPCSVLIGTSDRLKNSATLLLCSSMGGMPLGSSTDSSSKQPCRPRRPVEGVGGVNGQ